MEVTNRETKIQLVNADGEPIGDGPIDIAQLLEREQRAIALQDGKHRNVRVMLQEADEDYADYDDETAQRFREMDGENRGWEDPNGGAQQGDHDHQGFGEVNEYYNMIDDAQEELNASLSQRRNPHDTSENAGGALVSPKKRKKEKESERLERIKQEWTAAAPPAPVPPRNFRVLKSVAPDGGNSHNKFVPLSIAHHSAAERRVGTSERIVIFGGTNGYSEENELYEFSVTTATWRRLEGKLHVPLGSHSHAAATNLSSNKMYVVGGIGLGGAVPNLQSLDAASQDRYSMIFPRGSGGNKQKLAEKEPRSSLKSGGNGVTIVNTGSNKTGAPMIAGAKQELGVLHFVYEFNFATSQWHMVLPNFQHSICRHSTVSYNDAIYTFGGVNEAMLVSNSFVSMDTSSFACRMLRKAGEGPAARYSHTAVTYDHWMVVYGGADSNNDVLDDSWFFDFESGVWEPMTVIGEQTARMGHSTCVVGSKMLVAGGVSVAHGEESHPMDSIGELNLVPTNKGFVWREINCKPSIPAFCYGSLLGCGDAATVMTFGGLNQVKRKAKAASHKSNQLHDSTNKAKPSKKEEHHDEDNTALVPTNQCIMATFPIAHKKKSEDEESEEEVDPLQQPLDPKFIDFLKRQRKFVLEKQYNETKEQNAMNIKCKEDADTNLFLEEDEIDSLLRTVDMVLNTLRRYDMNGTPSNLPNRDANVKHVEEINFFIGQTRDVMRSMVKKELSEEDLKKKKKTRRKEGEKFEDFSSAKPFRRALIFSLLSKSLGHLKLLKKNNRSLGPFMWDQKEMYVEWTSDVGESMKMLTDKIKEVLDKYINERVESLQKNAERHKLALVQLRQVVEKIQHDKVWKKEGKDRHREARKKKLADDNATGEDGKTSKKSKSPWKKHPKHKAKEPDVTIEITKDDIDAVLKRCIRAKDSAQILTTQCGGGNLEEVHRATEQIKAQNEEQNQSQLGSVALASDAAQSPSATAVPAGQPAAVQPAPGAPQYGAQHGTDPALQHQQPPVEAPRSTLEELSRKAKDETILLCQKIFDAVSSFETGATTVRTESKGSKVHSRDVKALNEIRKTSGDIKQTVLKIRVPNPKPEDGQGPNIVDEHAHKLADDLSIKVGGLFQRLSNAFLTKTPMPRGRPEDKGKPSSRPASAVKKTSASPAVAGVQPKRTASQRPVSAPIKGKSVSPKGARKPASPKTTSQQPAAVVQQEEHLEQPHQQHAAQPLPAGPVNPGVVHRAVTPLTSSQPSSSHRPLVQQFSTVRPPSSSSAAAPQSPVSPNQVQQQRQVVPLQQQPPQVQQQQQPAAAPVTVAPMQQVQPSPVPQQQQPQQTGQPQQQVPQQQQQQQVMQQQVPQQQQQQPYGQQQPQQVVQQQQQEQVRPIPVQQVQPASVPQQQQAVAQQSSLVAQPIPQQQNHPQPQLVHGLPPSNYQAPQRVATPVVAGSFGGGVNPQFDDDYISKMYGGASKRGEPSTAHHQPTPTGSAGASRTPSAGPTQQNRRAVVPAGKGSKPQFKGPLTPGEKAILQSRQRNRQW